MAKLLAPNGKPSKLTPEQYKLVRTPAFKNWFGDWENSPETASKVVDENGEPMVLYHGTYENFNVFKSKKNFFTPSKQSALWFSKVHRTSKGEPKVYEVFLNSKKLIDRDFGSYNVFKKMIEAKAKKRFGSGWVWWIIMPNGYTRIIETPYQDNPQMYFNCEILLGVDVWEHAYFLKYQADRKGYVNNIFNVVNWNYANEILN